LLPRRCFHEELSVHKGGNCGAKRGWGTPLSTCSRYARLAPAGFSAAGRLQIPTRCLPLPPSPQSRVCGAVARRGCAARRVYGGLKGVCAFDWQSEKVEFLIQNILREFCCPIPTSRVKLRRKSASILCYHSVCFTAKMACQYADAKTFCFFFLVCFGL